MVNMKWDLKEARRVWRDEAREEGIEIGIEIGTEKGTKIGMKKGELKGKLETALNMLREKLPLEMVARVTNLSLETIEELAAQHKLV